jgi:hypothetical protein
MNPILIIPVMVGSGLLYILMGVVIATVFTKNINSVDDIEKDADISDLWTMKVIFWPIYLIIKIIIFSCKTMISLGAYIRKDIEKENKE